MHFPATQHNRSIAIKIVVTCLLACAAIFLSLYISRYTSRSILSTVDRLSKPKEKIQLVNRLFRNVVQLDQLQRAQALDPGPSDYSPLIDKSNYLQLMLDSLYNRSIPDSQQLVRIEAMKKLLYQRDLLFLHYLKLNSGLKKNDSLSRQVAQLTGMIEKAKVQMDNNLVTTSRTTTTVIDTLKQADKKQNLWNRIFTRKKASPKQVERKINEELRVRVDTMPLAGNADSIARLGAVIRKVEHTRSAQTEQLTRRQVELNSAGATLISQLISILNDIEAGEMALEAEQSSNANALVNKSVVTISVVLVIFIVALVVLTIFIFGDIARSNRYRRELVAAKEEAEEAGLVKQRFLSNMSHELRTPLQIIVGVAEQVRGKKQAQPRDIENIYQSAQQLLQTVNEVLDYNRITAGKLTLEHKPFHMHSLLHDVYEMVKVQAGINDLTLSFSAQVAEAGYYSGDAFRLRQILLNLLGNAIKFTEEGSISLSVTEEQLKNASLFTFRVSDTGIGIPEEDLSSIFNQFEQGSNTYSRQGTGLGLSIVKELVSLQNGTLEVTSEEHKGTTFTIRLRYKRTAAPAETTGLAAAATPYSGGHVWVIDDDIFILRLCDTILHKYDIPHTCFSSVSDVLQTPFPAGLATVMMDIRMPGMDGIALCAELRLRHSAAHPRYIALTAQALPDERKAILEKGFDELVMKPFLEEDLLQAITQQAIEGIQRSPDTEIDLSSICKMAGYDAALIRHTIESFISETNTDIAEAQRGVDNKDPLAIAEAMHRMAGRWGQMGAHSLAHRLRTIELRLLEHKEIDSSRAEIIASFHDIHRAIATIEDFLTKGNFTAGC